MFLTRRRRLIDFRNWVRPGRFRAPGRVVNGYQAGSRSRAERSALTRVDRRGPPVGEMVRGKICLDFR